MSKLYLILSYTFSSIIAFFAPISICFHVITFLVGIDLLTGIMKSFKQNTETKGFRARMRIIKSNKLRRSFLKWFLYIVFIMCVYAMEMAIGLSFSLYFAQIAFIMLAFVELYSIGENIDIVTEKKGLFISIITRIRKAFENKVSNTLTENK